MGMNLKGRIRNLLRAGGLFSTSIYANYLWSVLNLTLGKGLRLAGIALCVRQLHLESWGQVVATTATMALVALFLSQGLNGLPQMFRVNDRSLDAPLLRTILLYRIGLALVLIVGIFSLRGLLPGVTRALSLYSLVLIPMALNFEWLYHRRERYHIAMLINVVKAVVFFGQVLLFVRPGSSVYAVLRIEIIAETSGLLFSLLLLKRVGLRNSIPGGRIQLGVVLLAALPLFLSEAIQVLPGSLNVLLLKNYWGYDAVGQFDIGSKLGMAYFFLGASLVQIVVPKLTRLYETEELARMGRVLGASSGLLLALGSLLMLSSFYFAPDIIRLFFGKAFPQTVFVFQWISVWVYTSFMCMLNTIVLLSTGRRRTYLYGALLSVAVNLLATWFLVTRFSAAGAVFGRISSEVVFYVYALVKMPHGIKQVYGVNVLLQMASLAALIGIFLLVAPHSRVAGLALSLAFCGFVLWRRKVFSGATLGVLRGN